MLKAMALLRVLLFFCVFPGLADPASAWDSYFLHSRDVYVRSLEEGNVLLVSRWRGSRQPENRVSFYGIGIPSLRQPFGREARELLLKMLPPGRSVTLESLSGASGDETSALVQVGGASVNHRLLAEGLAWVDRGTCKAMFCRRWLIQEHLARKERRGLWSLNMSTPPWQWGEVKD